MAKLTAVRRITIVVDGTFEKQVLKAIADLGAQGYSLMECRGKGGHVLHDDIWFLSRVRIETIVQPDVAEKIVEHLDQQHHLAMTVCVENVDVVSPEKF
jgi:nitrogen regulatory protein P-II 2